MMQLKRVLVSLLVAVMMISMAVFAASAADTADGTFAIAVSAADSEGYIPVTPGDVLEVEIVITNNPGVSVASFAVVYDTAVLKYNGSYVFSEIYEENAVGTDKYGVVPGVDNKLHIFTNMMADKDVTETGVLITLSFEVLSGEKALVSLENIKANNSNGVRIEGVATSLACKHANITVLEAVDPTCTETGLTEGQQCADCEEILVAQDVVDANGHTEEILSAVDATCTATGLTAGKKCSVCGTVTVEQNEVAVKGHTSSDWIVDVEAAPGVEGSQHKECTECQTVLETETLAALPVETDPVETDPVETDPVETDPIEIETNETDTTPTGDDDNGSLTWLWILIACVVVIGGGAVAVYFLVIKKK